MVGFMDCFNFTALTEQGAGRADKYKFRTCPKIIYLTLTQPDKSLLSVIEKAFHSYTETYQELYLSSSGLLLLPERDEPLLLQILAPLKLGYWLGWQTKTGEWKFFVKAETFTANRLHKCSMFVL